MMINKNVFSWLKLDLFRDITLFSPVIDHWSGPMIKKVGVRDIQI